MKWASAQTLLQLPGNFGLGPKAEPLSTAGSLFGGKNVILLCYSRATLIAERLSSVGSNLRSMVGSKVINLFHCCPIRSFHLISIVHASWLP